jgi:tryptophan-rich sensory protein
MSLVYILIPIILSFIINILIFRKKNKNLIKSRNLKYLPPGSVIGTVWIILLGLLGYIYSLLENKNKSMDTQKILLILLTLFCLLYPILTANSTLRFSKNYNYLTLIFVLTVYYSIYTKYPKISYYLIPLLCWVLYVNIITLLDDIQLIKVF